MDDAKIGTTNVDKIYFGSTLWWQRLSYLVYASFNQADTTNYTGSADTGQAWDKSYCPTAVWGIRNGKLYLVSNTSGSPELLINDGHVSKRISLDITFSAIVDVVFRLSDATSYFYILVQSTAIKLYKKISGATTQLGIKTVALTAGNSYTLTAEDTGSAISVYLGGVLQFTANSTDLNIYTTAGFRFNTSYDTVSEFDNYKVEAI